MNKKLLFLSMMMPIHLLPIISCSNNSNELILKNDILFNKKEGLKNIDFKDNSFIENIEKYAKDDSILFYNVSFGGTAHKYVPIAHMLRVLQLNPKKQIFFFFNERTFSADFSALENKINSSEYANLKIIKYNKSKDFEYDATPIDYFKSEIKDNNLDKSKIVFIGDEYIFLRRLENYVNDVKIDMNDFIENCLLFFDFREVNMISDGTISTDFFNNNFFQYFVNNSNYFKLNKDKKIYEDSINFMKWFNKKTEIEKENYIRSKEIDIVILMWYFLLASYNNINHNDFVNVKFYLPSLKIVQDVNNSSSNNLSLNDKYDLFFNPYESKNLNFISLLSNLNSDTKKIFLQTLNISSIDIESLDKYEFIFNDSYNIVYSGSMISNNQDSLNNQVQTLISIYKENQKENNLKIWYKAHPREVANYDFLLKNELIKEGYEEVANSINFLNKTLPMEILISQPYMKSNKEKNREVKFYSGFSTTTLYFYSNNQENDLKRIIVNPSEERDIINRFGDPKHSTIFNSKITIKLSDFQNLYNFVTSIQKNRNYLIGRKDGVVIDWMSFDKYLDWPSFSYYNYAIELEIDNKKYYFSKIDTISTNNGGIKIIESQKFNNIILNSNPQEYSLDNYVKDLQAQSIMSFNIILQKENRLYTKGNLKIYYKNKGSWASFLDQTPFIFLVDK